MGVKLHPDEGEGSFPVGKGSVRRLSRALVKGTAVEHPQRMRFSDRGADGDRRFVVVDDDGVLITPRRHARLVLVHARLDGSPRQLSLSTAGDDGTGDVVVGPRDATATLELGGLRTVDVFGRRITTRDVVGPFDAFLSEHLETTVHLSAVEGSHIGQDDAPATLISSASMEEVASWSGTPPGLDTDRFRMNIEITGVRSFEEETWSGRTMSIGSAALRIEAPVPRCAVTRVDPATGERDVDVLRVLARNRWRRPEHGKALVLGMSARVMEPGIVAVGDAVVPID